MQAPDPAPGVAIILPRRRITSVEEADAAITAAAHAKLMLIAALEVPSPAAPLGDHPHPDPAAPDTPGELAAQAELPWTSVHPFSASAAVGGKCAACGREHGDAVHEQPGETPDDGPEPYHATSGPPCGAEDGNWNCNAQRGHGGPDHLNYAFGEIRHRWPRTAAAAACGYHGGTGSGQTGRCPMCAAEANAQADDDRLLDETPVAGAEAARP